MNAEKNRRSAWFSATSIVLLIGSAHINQHIITLNLQRNYIHFAAVRRQRLAAPRIKRPRVPWTNDCLTLNPSLSQRPSAVRADISERAQPAVHIGEADLQAIYFRLRHLARLRSLTQRAQGHPLTHSTLHRRSRMRCLIL